MYASEKDHQELLDYLNKSDEIAFIVSNGDRKWKAVHTIEAMPHGRYALWHIPAGPLPLMRRGEETKETIADPFAGWEEAERGGDLTMPWFGPGPIGILRLTVRASAQTSSGEPLVGMSSFEWIGNHYRIIGSAADPSTEKFWKALKRWVKKVAVRVPRGGPSVDTKPEIWAFADAQVLFSENVKGVGNPF
jgi:hypothetical protein